MIATQISPARQERVWAWRLAAAVLILGVAAVRVFYLAHDCPLDLAPDEAHYWDWSRHLDWSYYSKGPLVALLIRVSCELFGAWSQAQTGSEALAVRLPAVACGSLLLLSLYVLTVQVYCRERWALGVVAIALTVPLIAAGSTLMTIDAPFTCCWGWALVFGYRAVFRGSTWAWLATGLCVLTGLLAKHTMVLWVPSLGLFLLATPALRPWLRSPRFWMMAGIGALGALPILVWNMQHDWVTLRHTQGHMGANDEGGITWSGPLRYVITQFLVLLGFWFVAWIRAAWAYRPGREGNPEIGYLWWMSVPSIVFFLLFSVKNGGGEPNWPVAGYISGMVLIIGWLARELASGGPVYRRLSVVGITLTCAVGMVLTVAVHESSWFRPLLASLTGPTTPQNPFPMRRLDPTCRLRGWHVLAAEVDRMRAQLEAEGESPVLACSSWSLPGEIGFYGPGHPDVYSFGLALGDRHSQYDLWHPNPIADAQAFRGRTFLVVDAGVAALRPGFASVEPPRLVTYEEDGHVLAVWSITVARGYRGFPLPPGRTF